ncbi:unnamed protein product, partial [Prorocentrum cordatum]
PPGRSCRFAGSSTRLPPAMQRAWTSAPGVPAVAPADGLARGVSQGPAAPAVQPVQPAPLPRTRSLAQDEAARGEAGRHILALALGAALGVAAAPAEAAAAAAAQAAPGVAGPSRAVPPVTLEGQLRIIVAGLMGSGKSTLCRMLRHLFGGTWVNQDEFSHLGKGAKKAFLAEVKRAAGDKQTQVLLVDKINTLRQHRQEILDAMDAGLRGEAVLVEVRHPADPEGRWEHTAELCQARIEARGERHRTLKGSLGMGKVRGILQGTLRDAQPFTDAELARLRARLRAAADLGARRGRPARRARARRPRRRVVEPRRRRGGAAAAGLRAFRAAMAAEADLGGAAPPAVAGPPQGGAACRGGAARHPQGAAGGAPGQGAPEGGQRSPWIVEVALDADTQRRLRELWAGFSTAEPTLALIDDPHVTLLYLGGGSDKEVAERSPKIGDPARVQRLRLRPRLGSVSGAGRVACPRGRDVPWRRAEVCGGPFVRAWLSLFFWVCWFPGSSLSCRSWWV